MKNYLKQFQKYEKELAAIAEELSTLPMGHLGIKATTLYHIVGENHISITKDQQLITQLARKKYLQLRKKQLLNNLNPKKPFDTRSATELIASMATAYQKIPTQYFFHPSVQVWLNKKHKQNSINPDQAKFTLGVISFRSLAERTIAETLNHYNMPYKYDTVVDLVDGKISPDFIIKNPFNGNTYIWEHFGAFNQEHYADSMNNKLDRYEKSGFISNDNLIVSFEHHIRDTKRIHRLIEEIIL